MNNSLKTRRMCRNLQTSSRVRRQALAEKLDKDWHELRRYATIERDPEKLLRLSAEIDKRSLLAEATATHSGS
jgi:hypothetical protein